MSTVAWPRVSTSGKVFLAGEYGVLRGGEALVMAVDRRARVTGARPDPTDPRERAAAAALHDGLPGLPPGLPAVDTGAMHDDTGAKLGIGSSAAWAAAVAGSALCLLGADPSDPDTRDRAWRLGREVHGGNGSGADVAAAILGGVIRYRIPPGAPPQASPAALPPARLPLIVRGGVPVPTLGAVEAAGEAEHDRRMAAARQVGDALVAALLDPEGDPMPAVREAAEVLLSLSRALGLGAGAGSEVVAAADRAARPFGGAAKPSGAGGGDLVLVYLPELDAPDRARATRALLDADLALLDLRVDPRGLAFH